MARDASITKTAVVTGHVIIANKRVNASKGKLAFPSFSKYVKSQLLATVPGGAPPL